MPFQDIPTNDPYLRLFYEGAIKSFVFSSHGIWSPGRDGITRLRYTYYWYTQPTAVLSGEQYEEKITEMGTASPVDTSGPGSGQVQNTLLVPLEQGLFAFTARTFRDMVKKGNPSQLALLAFFGNKKVPGMRLSQVDTQLLPALRHPVQNPVHMVVCRSLDMKHVVPNVTNQVVVTSPLPTPFNSITNDML